MVGHEELGQSQCPDTKLVEATVGKYFNLVCQVNIEKTNHKIDIIFVKMLKIKAILIPYFLINDLEISPCRLLA